MLSRFTGAAGSSKAVKGGRESALAASAPVQTPPLSSPPPLAVRVQMAAASAPASNAEDRLLQVRERVLAKSGMQTRTEQATSRSRGSSISHAEVDSKVNARMSEDSGRAGYMSDAWIQLDTHSTAEKSLQAKQQQRSKRKFSPVWSPKLNIEELQQSFDWKRRRLEEERLWKATQTHRRVAKAAAKKSVDSKIVALVAAGTDPQMISAADPDAEQAAQLPGEVQNGRNVLQPQPPGDAPSLRDSEAPAASSSSAPSEAATVTFEFPISVAMVGGDELVVTAPSNFAFRRSPAPTAVEVNSGINGLIASYLVEAGGRRLVTKLSRELPAASSAVLSATMDLPSEQQQTGNWQLLARSGISPRKVYEQLEMQFNGFSIEDEQTEPVPPPKREPEEDRAAAEVSASFAPQEDVLKDGGAAAASIVKDLEKSRPQLTAPLWKHDERFVLARQGKRTTTAYEVWTTSFDNARAVQSVEEVQDAYADHHRLIYMKKRPTWTLNTWKNKLRCGNVSKWIRGGVTVLRAICNVPGGPDVVVGYISGSQRAGFVHVNHIIVLPEHRQRGVGRLLFDAFVKYFEGVRSRCTEDVRLEVYSANTAVEQWYLALGFKRLCKGDVMEMKREIPYVEVEDVFHMALEPLVPRLQNVVGDLHRLAQDIEGLDVSGANFDLPQSEALMSRADQLLQEMNKPELQALSEDTDIGRHIAPRLRSWREDAMKLKAWLSQLLRTH